LWVEGEGCLIQEEHDIYEVETMLNVNGFVNERDRSALLRDDAAHLLGERDVVSSALS
jgi:hypothetical protein